MISSTSSDHVIGMCASDRTVFHSGDMRVLVTGASGLIGTALLRSLEPAHEVVSLTRRPRGRGQYAWDPMAGALDETALDGADAVVHLAGESVAPPWTSAKKHRIRESRVRGTELLAQAAAAHDPRPRVLVCASAVGYYGDRGDEPLSEESRQGEGFLAEVVRDWEGAADPARAAGIRVAHMRFGVVQSREGGALRAQLPLFRVGLGGRVGSGRQYVSWVAIDDVVGAIEHALASQTLAGPVNVTAPQPVTNAEYVRTLGRVLRRPAVLPAPARAVRLALGGFAGELLFSRRVLPERLRADGFEFRHPELEGALRHVLNRR
jgi:uncharacterized protein